MKRFNCFFCGSEFSTGGLLTRHLSDHTGEQLLSCVICKDPFTSEFELKSHLCSSESPQDRELLKCSQCDERFSKSEDLNLHLRIHTKGSLFSCSVCSTSCNFAWRRHLTKHMEVHMKRKKVFRCRPCGAEFSTYYLLTKHKVVHQLLELSRGQTEENREENEHMESSADGDDFEGLEPTKHPNTEADSQERSVEASACFKAEEGDLWTESTKPEEAKEDLEFFTVKENQEPVFNKEEVKLEDPNPPQIKEEEEEAEINPEENEKMFSDPDTDDSDFWKPNGKHRSGSNSESDSGRNKAAASLQPESDDSVDSDFWKESRKPQSNVKSSGQEATEIGAKYATVLKPYGCTQCNKVFRYSSYLKIHMKQHTERYFCSVCGHRSIYSSNLKVHMRIHTGEKPFSCSFCPKKFSNKASMQSHMSVHYAERKYSCDKCKKCFGWYTELKYHRCVGGSSHEQTYEEDADINLKRVACKRNKDSSSVKVSIPDTKPESHGKKTNDKPRNYEHVDNSCKHSDLSETKEILLSDPESYPPKTIFMPPEILTRSEQSYNMQINARYPTTEEHFICSDCGKAFASGGHLTRHQSVHTGQKLLRCIVCEKTFPSEQMLTSSNLCEKPFRCYMCSEDFARQEYLTFHFKQHVRCSVCNGAFDDGNTLNQHTTSHAGQTQFCCPVDYAEVRPPRENSEWFCRPKEGFSCQACSRTFKHRRVLFRHATVHIRDAEQVCGLCGERFGADGGLKLHLLTHTRKRKKLDPALCGEQLGADGGSKPHRQTHTRKEQSHGCRVCGKSFDSEVVLIKHVEDHAKENECRCGVCGKHLDSSDNLTLHLQTHSSRSKTCHVCGKKFHSIRAQETHLKLHAGEKLFNCHLCGKSFSKKANMLTLLKSQTAENALTCTACSEELSNSNSLEHCKSDHNKAVPFSCKDCGKDFPTSPELEQHIEIPKSDKQLIEGSKQSPTPPHSCKGTFFLTSSSCDLQTEEGGLDKSHITSFWVVGMSAEGI
uniref:C2H2-type domain-containing protein n=1 Tax=Nothobranchius furzeri TaxID=105023 RepID=A0A8C6P071_NOTFU